MKKMLMVAGVITAVGLTGALGTMTASALAGQNGAGATGVIDRMVEKFNLNKDEVTAVFDEAREARQAEREALLAEKLASAVSDGTLTQEQADKITAKRNELREARQTAMNSEMTVDERREVMQAQREALEQWAEDNGIDLEYLHLGFGVHEGGGRGERGGFGHMKTDDSTN